MPFEIGQTIGGYEFIDVLDTSGTGITYKVRNPLAQRFEVLKILSKELREDRERVDRFLREAKIHARLSHPNIASFYNAMEIEGQLVMTMELVEGESLDQILREALIPLPQAIDYAIQALSALEYAHNSGVIHRNVAPSGIIVTPQGTIKVTDFDLAKTVSDPRLTLTGMVMGEMHYISPEQVKGLPTLDARTDVYSMGVVLYEMIAGKRPFESKSQFEVMQGHVQTPPRPLRELRPHLPAELDGAVLTALAKEPSERFQTAGEFRAALEHVKAILDQPPEEAPVALSHLSTTETMSSREAAFEETETKPMDAAPEPLAEEAEEQAAEIEATTPLKPKPAVPSRADTPAEPVKALPQRRPAMPVKRPAPVPPSPNPMVVGLITFLVVTGSFILFLIIANW